MSRPGPPGSLGSPGSRESRDRPDAAGRRAPRDAGGLVVAGLLSLALALVVCGRSLGRGLVLYRDFVTVDDLATGPALFGRDGEPPRAVPLDAVTAALSTVVAPGVQQQIMLLASLVLAGTGVAVLLRGRGTAAMVAGAAVATWNPFVAERLALGQPPTLLAYSMTPWLVAVVRSRWSTGRSLTGVLVCAVPAALTPWGSVVAAVVVLAAGLVTTRRRHVSWLVGAGGLAVLWCLPWVVPAVLHGSGSADPDGAPAFALRADSPLGMVGSALTLGGSWAVGVVPDSRSSTTAAAASLVLVALCIVGLVLLGLRGGRRPALVAAAAWLLPIVVALVLAGPGTDLFAELQRVPGVAIGRDTHRWLGLSATTSAVLVGVAVGHGVRWAHRGGSRRVVAGAASVAVLSTTVLTVPDLPASVASSYRPIDLPADWAPMVGAAEQAAGEGRVLLLPYQPFRRVDWVGGQPFLDPTPRALDARVLGSHQLVVARGGVRWTVDDDEVAAQELGLGSQAATGTTGTARGSGAGSGAGVAARAGAGAGAAGGALDLAVLHRHGVTAVVEWQGSPGVLPTSHDGLTKVFAGPNFTVWAVTRSG